ncbi:MAG: ABC transporter substrate-binding protein [Rickettsiales bacterium]|nr:ABC transporter substrate-binding protein [Rickettsiales bacterium]
MRIYKIKIIAIFCSIFLLNSSWAESFRENLSLFGDAKYGADFRNFDYVNPDAPKGGGVRFGVEGGFNSLNKFILKGISASGLSYLYDSLMEGSDDEISVMYPLVAQSVLFDKNKGFLIFRLNKKARFHDGVEITADDVVFSFNRLVAEGHPTYKLIFRDVKEVKKLGKYLVKFDFSGSKNRDLPFAIASISVLPKHYYDNVAFNKTTLQPPLGSGPYKIVGVEANHSITYERVKDYWAKDLAVNRGKYNFDTISYDYYHDKSVLVEAFKSQKYDFRQENVARNWASAYNIEAVKSGAIIKKKIKHSLPVPMQAFVLNLRREKFRDIELRKALNYAFDFEWLKKNIFYGSYERTSSFFENSNFSYSDFELPKGSGDGFNRKNLIIAQDILEKAGYVLRDNYLFDKNGKKVSLEFLIGSKNFEMIIAPFVKNLKKLGIDASVKFVEENQYKTRVNNFDYDIIVGIFPQALIPGNELYAYFHSSQKDVKGSRNMSGLDNHEVDKLVVEIAKVQKKEELEKLCRKLDKILLENYYVIAQWYSGNYRILYRDIFLMPKKHAKYSLVLDSWYLKQYPL